MKKTIALFYTVFTVYILLVCFISNLSFLPMLPALILMWIIYFCFSLSFGIEQENLKRYKENNEVNEIRLFGINTDDIPAYRLLIYGIIICIMSVLCARFYTGQTPISLIQSITAHTSSYAQYQQYFAENNIAVFSLSKIPYIIMLAFNKGMLFFSFILLTNCGRIFLRKYRLYILLISIAHIYFGLARGTNIEVFQLFALILFCYISRKQKVGKRINYVLIAVLGLILIVIFSSTVSIRSASDVIRLKDLIPGVISVDYKSITVSLFPGFAAILISLFGYIGFGLFYIAQQFSYKMESISGFMDWLVGKVQNDSRIIDEITNRGVKWIPDLATLIEQYGIILVFIFVILIGGILRKIRIRCNNSGDYQVVKFLVFLEMISLPMGNLLSYSSEKLLVLFCCLLIIFRHSVKLVLNKKVLI